MDHKRMMQLAGLKILAEDVQQGMDTDEQQMEWERGKEKLIALCARQTGVELWDNHAVYIEGNTCEVKVDTGTGMPLSHLMQFANKLASAQVGHDIKIQGSADLFITLSFTLI